MKEILIDRRKSIRIEGDFNLKLASGKTLRMGKTIDLNLRGMCCEVRGKVPIFEEIQIRLKLPLSEKESPWLTCKGVVVRCEPADKKGDYRMAFYFTDWDPLSRERLRRFIQDYPLSEAA